MKKYGPACQDGNAPTTIFMTDFPMIQKPDGEYYLASDVDAKIAKLTAKLDAFRKNLADAEDGLTVSFMLGRYDRLKAIVRDSE